MVNHIEAEADFVRLYSLNLIPLYTVLAALVWVLHDYCLTLEDEIAYIWRQKLGFGTVMFFWIRYYTIFLVAFDALQIHSFAIPGVVNLDLYRCLAADPTVRVAGALSLWSVQVIMQMRIYVLYNRSRKVALFNAIVFITSIGAFLVILVLNALHRKKMIAAYVGLPLKGCPAINGGIQWSLWVPAMCFESVLFSLALYKSIRSATMKIRLNERSSLASILLHENLVYFFIVTFVLFMNNLMVIGATKIPWFGFAPFHGALGITIGRMLIRLRKLAENDFNNSTSNARSLPPIQFIAPDITSHLEQTTGSYGVSDPNRIEQGISSFQVNPDLKDIQNIGDRPAQAEAGPSNNPMQTCFHRE